MKRYIATILFLGLCFATQARTTLSFNEGWRFYFKSENSSDNARHVTLPHTWNTDTRGYGYFLETTANYQNDFFIPAEWSTKRLFIKFYGVQSVANVFLNGSHIGEHRGGAAAFTLELTDKIRFGNDNALVVVVSNNCNPDVLPTSTDINLYGGIYREAEVIITDRSAISPLYFGSDGVLVHQTKVDAESVEGEVEVHLASPDINAPCQLVLDILSPEGERIFSRTQKARFDGKSVSIPFDIDTPELWSITSPSLYQVRVRLETERSRDEVTIRTGFRTINITPQGRFQLNGTKTPIRGVTLYHDNSASGCAFESADYDYDLHQIRDMGANALRSAVMPHAQYFYDRCDEQGMLVWVDLPFHRAPFLGDVAYYATTRFEQNGLDQMQEIITQNYNHPSVAMWGLFSLLSARGDDTTPYLRRLNEKARHLDPSRPTVACSDQDGGINFITDLIVWQQTMGWEKGSPDDVIIWRDLLRKKWSHLRSAISYGIPGFLSHKSLTAQSAQNANWAPEERQTKFHEEYTRNLQSDSLFWGVWITNMYDYGSARRPYGINGSGIVSLNRRDCKDAYYLYKTLWNKQSPTLHITDKRHRLRDYDRQAFRVYSSAGAPTLLINRDTIALKEYSAGQYQSDTVTLTGRVWVKAEAGALRDSVELTVGNLLKQKRTPALRRITSPQTTN